MTGKVLEAVPQSQRHRKTAVFLEAELGAEPSHSEMLEAPLSLPAPGLPSFTARLPAKLLD